MNKKINMNSSGNIKTMNKDLNKKNDKDNKRKQSPGAKLASTIENRRKLSAPAIRNIKMIEED